MHGRAPRRDPPWPLLLALSAAAHGGALAARWGHGQPTAIPAPTAPDPAPAMAGDTFDVEASSDPTNIDAPEESAAPPGAGPASRPIRAAAPYPAAQRGHTAPPPLFGAVGVRYATDLATAFTRALPQVASADAAWTSEPLGSTASAVVTVVIDEDGRIAEKSVSGAPSVTLRRGLERTLVLLGSREFTAKSPTVRLRITAHVSRDDVHDGLHGDVFALSGGSFASDVGTAFFALPPREGPGRRVDVEVRLLP